MGKFKAENTSGEGLGGSRRCGAGQSGAGHSSAGAPCGSSTRAPAGHTCNLAGAGGAVPGPILSLDPCSL